MFEILPTFVESLGLLVMLAVGVAYIQSISEGLENALLRQLLIGCLFGIVIVAVMLHPITLPTGSTFDPRAGPAILAGIIGGPVAAIVAAVMGGLARYYVVAGPVALAGASGFLFYGMFGIIVGQVLERRNKKLDFWKLVLLGVLGTVAVLPAFFSGSSRRQASRL